MEATLTPRLQRAAAATYADFEPLIRGTVYRFVQAYGGNYDDTLADASTHFMRGFAAPMRATCGTYERHFTRWIWNGLLDERRTVLSRRSRYEHANIEEVAAAGKLTTQDAAATADQLLEQFTGDARVVVGLVLVPPYCLELKSTRRGGEPRNFRSCLREHLRARGWGTQRVADAFAQIKDLL